MLVAVDFFCGAGGTTCGLLDAGIDVVCGIDNDIQARFTYESNNVSYRGVPCTFMHNDLALMLPDALWNILHPCPNQGLVFAGCPPCQPFTNLNTDKAKQGQSRNLILAYLRMIRCFRPDYVLMENVPGIRARKYGRIFDFFLSGLEELGYYTSHGILNARDFGVPQSRRRMIVLAALQGRAFRKSVIDG